MQPPTRSQAASMQIRYDLQPVRTCSCTQCRVSKQRAGRPPGRPSDMSGTEAKEDSNAEHNSHPPTHPQQELQVLLLLTHTRNIITRWFALQAAE